MKAMLLLAAAGVLGTVGILVGFFVDARQALFSYLTAWTFAATLAVGALTFVMMANVARATWFVVLKRIPEAIATTFPLLAVLFVPIAMGMRPLYSWATPEASWSQEVAEAVAPKRAWLEPGFFVARAAVYLVTWSVFAVLLRRSSIALDASPDERRADRARALSAAGLPVVGLTVTFAAFDWLMSLDPAWRSTTFGFYVFSGGFAGAVGLVAVFAWRAHALALMPAHGAPQRLHAAGRVLFAFVIFWAYIAFTQLLIIWIADLPAEVRFYAARVRGSWSGVCWLLGLGHFVLPFFALLSRSLKRSAPALALVGGWLVVAHYVDVYWLVMPVLHGEGLRLSWLDLAALFAVCGFTGALGVSRFRAARPVPRYHPDLRDGLRYESP